MTPFTWPQVAVEAATEARITAFLGQGAWQGMSPARKAIEFDLQRAALSAAIEAMTKADMAREGVASEIAGTWYAGAPVTADGGETFPCLILKSGPGEKGEA